MAGLRFIQKLAQENSTSNFYEAEKVVYAQEMEISRQAKKKQKISDTRIII